MKRSPAILAAARFRTSDRRPVDHWLILTAILLLAAVLRIDRLGASALRGDEAFTIRYWTQSLPAVINSLAAREPHPVAVMLAFGGWKALAGDSEFAMRALPALINLLGVPALYGLGRRLFHDRGIGYVAALLWAVNPAQIWHAQDARDYAIWAALSACAFWLLIKAINRNRWRDWALYVIAAVMALSSYFAEASFVLVGAVFVIGFNAWSFKSFLSSHLLRRYLIALIAIGILSIPWLVQAWALAHSGYGGTASTSFIPDLWLHFLPALVVGDVTPRLAALWPGLVALLAIAILLLSRVGVRRIGILLALAIVIPAGLLALAATRIAVFRVDYLLAADVPILLLLSYVLTRTYRVIQPRNPVLAYGLTGLVAIGLVVWPLSAYWGYSKAPDWRALRDYLIAHVTPADAVIITTDDPTSGAVDPAFDYYMQGRVTFTALPYGSTQPDALTATVTELANTHRALWFVPSGQYAGAVDQAMRGALQPISDEGADSWIIREFRSATRLPDEIDHPFSVISGFDHFALQGYSLEQTAAHLTVLLYWVPGQSTADTVFVHLVGGKNPQTNTPLWSQDDHPPVVTTGRDVYRLDLGSVQPGTYQLQIGLYDPQTGTRRTLLKNGQPIGDQATLTTIVVP